MTTQQRLTICHEFEVPRGTIRTTLNVFSGRTYFDCRLWVEPRDQPGAALIPTRRGLSLPLEYLPEVSEALEAIDHTIKRERGELAGRRRGTRRSSAATRPSA